jgi:hypothetical protein
LRDILFCVVSKLLGEALRRPGEAARLRKGLFEERLTDKVAVSRPAVFGEGRRGSVGWEIGQWAGKQVCCVCVGVGVGSFGRRRWI